MQNDIAFSTETKFVASSAVIHARIAIETLLAMKNLINCTLLKVRKHKNA